MVIGFQKWMTIMTFPTVYYENYKYAQVKVNMELMSSLPTHLNHGGWSVYDVEDNLFQIMKECARIRRLDRLYKKNNNNNK